MNSKRGPAHRRPWTTFVSVVSARPKRGYFVSVVRAINIIASKTPFKKRMSAKHNSQETSMLPFNAYQPRPAVRSKKMPPMMSTARKRATATGKKKKKTERSHGFIFKANAEGGAEVGGRPWSTMINRKILL